MRKTRTTIVNGALAWRATSSLSMIVVYLLLQAFNSLSLANSLDATVYFEAHGTNCAVTTGGARDDLLQRHTTETHHWSMEEMINWRSTERMEWTDTGDYYCY